MYGFTDEEKFKIQLYGNEYFINTQEEKRTFAFKIIEEFNKKDEEIRNLERKLLKIQNILSKYN